MLAAGLARYRKVVTEAGIKTINERMVRGMVWMVGARLADRAVGLISTIFLARLLIPADFGLVALATAIISMLDLLGSFSFDVTLIQKSNAERRHYDTAWTFNILFGLLCTVALVLVAPAAASFYSEPRLELIMYVLSACFVVNGLNNIGMVNFRKNLDFRQEFIFMFSRRIISFVITLGAAFYFRSYWALVAGLLVGRIANLVMSYTMSSYRPRFSLSAASELFGFSKWMFLNNLLHFLRHDGCTFIIGRMFGARELGIYTIAYELSNLPTNELMAPLNRVAFPSYAKMGSIDLIRASYLSLLGLVLLVVAPIGVGIAAVAEPLVLTVLGDKWGDSAPLMSILALSGAIIATQTNNSAVYMAIGKPHKITIVQVCYLLILFPSLYWCLTRYGLIGAGYAYLGAQIVDAILQMRISRNILHFSWGQIASVTWRPVIATALMYLVVIYIHQQVLDLPSGMQLIIDVLSGVAVYALAVLLMWIASARPSGAETLVLQKLKLIPPQASPA